MKDKTLANTKVLEDNAEIISVMDSGGQYQIIIGTHVDKVYRELEKVVGSTKTGTISDEDKQTKEALKK